MRALPSPSGPSQRAPSGFSLLELMVALSISGLVITVATSAVLSIQRSIASTRASAQVDEEAKMLAEHLVSVTRNVGGSLLRPWNAIEVENDCAAADGFPDCDGSDRLTLIDYDPEVGNCALIAKSGSKLLVESVDTDGDLIADTCCLDTLDLALWQDRSAQIIDKTGVWERVKLKKKGAVDGHACAIEFSVKKKKLEALVGARLAATTERTYYLRRDMHTLHEYVDTNQNDVLDPEETRVVADQVYDLQVALGYDTDNDGQVRDTNGTDDEWQFNAPGSDTPAGWSERNLRMIAVGVVVGNRVPTSPGTTLPSLRVLDGAPVSAPRTLLRSSLARVYFRNNYIFQ